MIIGNFTNVGGRAPWQAAMIDISTSPETVANWHTDGSGQSAPCASVFDTYMRGVAFAPDGTYFVIVTTGGYNAGTLCDTTARFETAARGPESSRPGSITAAATPPTPSPSPSRPSTPADTSGGQQRLAGDQPGPGAVERARASRPSTPRPGWRSHGTPPRSAVWRCSSSTRPSRGSGWEATPTSSPERRAARWPSSRSPGHRRPGERAVGSPTTCTTCRSSPARHPTHDPLPGQRWRSDAGFARLRPRLGRATDGARKPSTATPATEPASGPASTLPADIPTTTHRRCSCRSAGTTAVRRDGNGTSRWPAGTPVEVRLYFANQYGGTANAGQAGLRRVRRGRQGARQLRHRGRHRWHPAGAR